MSFTKGILPVLLFALMGCTHEQHKPVAAPRKLSIEEKRDSTKRQEEKREDSISDHRLRELNEPDLKKVTYEAYRLDVWQAFYPNYFLLRIENKPDGCKLTVKSYTRSRNNRDSILIDSVISIKKSQWEDFKAFIDGSYFWSLERRDGHVYFDGWGVSLEGFAHSGPPNDTTNFLLKENHHAVYRQCPPKGSFRDACEYLLNVSNMFVIKDGLQIEKKFYTQKKS